MSVLHPDSDLFWQLPKPIEKRTSMYGLKRCLLEKHTWGQNERFVETVKPELKQASAVTVELMTQEKERLQKL